jgi:hypothetical protein
MGVFGRSPDARLGHGDLGVDWQKSVAEIGDHAAEPLAQAVGLAARLEPFDSVVGFGETNDADEQRGNGPGLQPFRHGWIWNGLGRVRQDVGVEQEHQNLMARPGS